MKNSIATNTIPIFLAIVAVVGITWYFINMQTNNNTKGELFSAIDQDDGERIKDLIKEGANPNELGVLGTTPAMYAVANYKKEALKALLDNGADVALRDTEGDNAVTLAVETYVKDSEILALVLEAGGDPDTRRADDDPVIIRFINDRNCDAIKFMKLKDADINIRDRSGDPIILYAATIEYWDVVWCLLELGANYNYENERFPLEEVFDDPRVTPPDSPLYPYKVKVWEFLNKNRMKLSPLK